MARIRYQEAAELEVKRDRPPAGPPPSRDDLVKLYVKEERSVRDVVRKLVLDEGQDLNEVDNLTRERP